VQLLVLKFGLDRIYNYGDIAIFTFCSFGFAYSRPFLEGKVLGHCPPYDITHCLNLQEALPYAETRRLSHKAWKLVQRFDSGAFPRKKGQDDRTGQDRTGQSKKSQGGNISPILGEALTILIRTKICMVGSLPDKITYAKF